LSQLFKSNVCARVRDTTEQIQKIPRSPPRPKLFWGPPSLLSNGYQGLVPWG